MNQNATRVSPVYDALDALHPRWGEICGMPAPLDFGNPAMERRRAAILGLCDVSALIRLTVKGPAAEEFLKRQHLTVPAEVYEVQQLGQDGLTIRTGGVEFFLESGPRDDTVSVIAETLGRGGEGVYPVLRQDASFLLSGSRALEVLVQTCGINFRETGQQFVMSRIAGVSCGILLRELNNVPVYQLWLDFTYGPYLWDQLLGIVRELNGGPVGVSFFFPESR
jgi:sarcosine oxidase subunit gamma